MKRMMRRARRKLIEMLRRIALAIDEWCIAREELICSKCGSIMFFRGLRENDMDGELIAVYRCYCGNRTRRLFKKFYKDPKPPAPWAKTGKE